MPPGKTILLVDDDPNILAVAGFAVAKAGFRTITAKNGQEALALARSERPDLMVLDIVMPELGGIEVFRLLRAKSALPVIFLSSMDDEVDRIVGLELGADDYLTKPFSPRELVARIKAVLRRTEGNAAPPAGPSPEQRQLLAHGRLQLDLDGVRACWQGEDVPLTATEFGIMKRLISCPGKVFSRDQLAGGDASGVFVSDRTIDSHIRHIRDKFRQVGGEPIETVHGIGYKLATIDRQGEP